MDYPKPLVVPPLSLPHQHTFAFLYGRGSSADAFGPPLLDTPLSPRITLLSSPKTDLSGIRSLSAAFPHSAWFSCLLPGVRPPSTSVRSRTSGTTAGIWCCRPQITRSYRIRGSERPLSSCNVGVASNTTPVSLGHGVLDDKVSIVLGRQARDTLIDLKLKVTWKEHDGLGS